MRSTTIFGATQPAQNGVAAFADPPQRQHLKYYTDYRDRSPGFHTELGFIPRVNIRRVSNFAGYQWWPERSGVVFFGPGLFTMADWDYSGRLQDWSVETPFTFSFKGPGALEISRQESYEFYGDRGFQKYGTSIEGRRNAGSG